MSYRFSFKITDNDTDETKVTDWTSFELQDIDAVGAVETIDITTSCALRALRRIIEREKLQALLTISEE